MMQGGTRSAVSEGVAASRRWQVAARFRACLDHRRRRASPTPDSEARAPSGSAMRRYKFHGGGKAGARRPILHCSNRAPRS
eukprot:scaffold31812_cov58-Phaeocystis_antarctica.AAC.3